MFGRLIAPPPTSSEAFQALKRKVEAHARKPPPVYNYHRACPRAAREILALADRHQRDGQLSVVEIETFLKGSEHEEFATWLLQRRAARFKTFDRDHGADLDLAELAAALAQVRGTPTRCFCCRRRSLVLSEWALAPRSRSRALL